MLKEAVVAYRRRRPDASLTLAADCAKQTNPLITYTERRVTDPVADEDNHHTPLAAETRTYELTGYAPAGTCVPAEDFVRFQAKDSSGPTLTIRHASSTSSTRNSSMRPRRRPAASAA